MITLNRDRAASTLPLVSVIIPAYNAEAFIEKTLNSLIFGVLSKSVDKKSNLTSKKYEFNT